MSDLGLLLLLLNTHSRAMSADELYTVCGTIHAHVLAGVPIDWQAHPFAGQAYAAFGLFVAGAHGPLDKPHARA